jgi:poly(3-hydroxyalkanoate) synthetase
MNKLVVILAGVFLMTGLAACQSNMSGKGNMMEECRKKCNRIGQSVAVTATGVAGECVCSNDESSNA